jgi:hypothetical protein
MKLFIQALGIVLVFSGGCVMFVEAIGHDVKGDCWFQGSLGAAIMGAALVLIGALPGKAAGVTAFILAMAGWAVCIVWGWPKP